MTGRGDKLGREEEKGEETKGERKGKHRVARAEEDRFKMTLSASF